MFLNNGNSISANPCPKCPENQVNKLVNMQCICVPSNSTGNCPKNICPQGQVTDKDCLCVPDYSRGSPPTFSYFRPETLI